MARELHTLNETEMGMVNEYVEMGISGTHEEALNILIEQGVIQDSVGGSFVFAPEGILELAFHSGHQKSLFTQANDIAEEREQDVLFKKGNWYLGANFPKNKESKELEFDKIEIGEILGKTPEVIPTHILYKGARFNPSNVKTAVETTLGFSMTNEHQKQMIDLKSKKSLYELRQEQLKEYGVKKYSDITVKEDKIKFLAIIYGLVKTKDGWKPCSIESTIGSPEYNMINNFLEEKKQESLPLQKYKCIIDTKENKDNKGTFFKVLKVQEKVSEDLAKEVSSLVMHNIKSISKFLSDQKDSVSKTSSISSGQAPQVDILEDEEIDWDK